MTQTTSSSILLTFWFIYECLISYIKIPLKEFIFLGSFKLDRKNILIYGAGKAGAQISSFFKRQ